MKRSIIFAVLLATASLAFAQAQPYTDEWNAGDKKAHFLSGAVISGIATAYTDSAGTGILLGCGAGVAGELADVVRYGRKSVHVSYKDAVAQCLGAAVIGTGFKLYSDKVVWEIKF